MTGYGIRMEINPDYLTGKLPPELIPFYNKQNEVSSTMVNIGLVWLLASLVSTIGPFFLKRFVKALFITVFIIALLIDFLIQANYWIFTKADYFYNDLLSTVSAIVLSLILFTDVLEPKENQSELTSDQDAY